MSHHHHKRHRSSSHSRPSPNEREVQQNRSKDRSNDYERRTDSYERYLHPVPPNRQYDYHDPPILIDEIISHTEEYPPNIQSLIHELLLEQKKRKLVEERLIICEHNYAHLRAQHEQTVNNLTLLKHDFDQCRLDLKNSCIELNELRHSNSQYQLHIEQLLNNERQQMYPNDETFYPKRHRRY